MMDQSTCRHQRLQSCTSAPDRPETKTKAAPVPVFAQCRPLSRSYYWSCMLSKDISDRGHFCSIMIQWNLELLPSCERQAYGEMVCICASVNQSQVPKWLLLFCSQLRLTKDWYLFLVRGSFPRNVCVHVCVSVCARVCTCMQVSLLLAVCDALGDEDTCVCASPSVCVGVVGHFGKRTE